MWSTYIDSCQQRSIRLDHKRFHRHSTSAHHPARHSVYSPRCMYREIKALRNILLNFFPFSTPALISLRNFHHLDRQDSSISLEVLHGLDIDAHVRSVPYNHSVVKLVGSTKRDVHIQARRFCSRENSRF